VRGKQGSPPVRRSSRRSRRAVRGARRGFTLLEVLITISAMLIAALGFSQALVSAMRAEEMTREQSQATEAARAKIEELRQVNFRDVFRQYNDFTDDDLAGPGTAPGAHFDVRGLTAMPADVDGLSGEVLFPVFPAAPGALREDAVVPELNCPRNLDGVPGIDANDHNIDYLLLPVLVRIRWQGVVGPSEIVLRTILGEAL
jgi:prepilin-type N-terminal cleavage/methylation domain-containing protein